MNEPHVYLYYHYQSSDDVRTTISNYSSVAFPTTISNVESIVETNKVEAAKQEKVQKVKDVKRNVLGPKRSRWS